MLDQAIEIKTSEYIRLENPIFKGQTRPNHKGEYWMVFENNGVLFKIINFI